MDRWSEIEGGQEQQGQQNHSSSSSKNISNNEGKTLSNGDQLSEVFSYIYIRNEILKK